MLSHPNSAVTPLLFSAFLLFHAATRAQWYSLCVVCVRSGTPCVCVCVCVCVCDVGMRASVNMCVCGGGGGGVWGWGWGWVWVWV